MSEQAYPLSWPLGWKRAPYRWHPRFGTRAQGLSVAEGLSRLSLELDRLGVTEVVVSTNIRTKPNGLPYSGDKKPDDPGVAVYFKFKGKKTVMACDRWLEVGDNIGAIAKHIDALRGIDRWGVGSLEQAFRGYQQLEDFTRGVPWRRVLGFKDDQDVTLEMAESRFRELAKKHHPDITGADDLQMAQIGEAIAEARKQLRQAA